MLKSSLHYSYTCPDSPIISSPRHFQRQKTGQRQYSPHRHHVFSFELRSLSGGVKMFRLSKLLFLLSVSRRGFLQRMQYVAINRPVLCERCVFPVNFAVRKRAVYTYLLIRNFFSLFLQNIQNNNNIFVSVNTKNKTTQMVSLYEKHLPSLRSINTLLLVNPEILLEMYNTLENTRTHASRA